MGFGQGGGRRGRGGQRCGHAEAPGRAHPLIFDLMAHVYACVLAGGKGQGQRWGTRKLQAPRRAR
jgi:hypothetical protein